MSLNETLRTWTAGETPTAALMNDQIRDPLNGIQAAWDSYTAVWSAATVNPSLGNATRTSRYLRIGKTIWFSIDIVMGSTTTYGTGQWSLLLPVAARDANRQRFLVELYDDSASATYPGYGVLTSTTELFIRTPATTAGNPDRVVNSSTPFTWATSDRINVSGCYEAA